MSEKPISKIASVANLFSKMMHFKKTGDAEQGHAHQYDHLTLLAKGSLEVIIDDQSTIFTAPHMIYIMADKVHRLVAVEDDTVAYCIHALRDCEDNLLDPNMIPKGADALIDGIARSVLKKI